MKKLYALLVIALAGLVISITAPQAVSAAVTSVQASARTFFSGITTFAAQLKVSNGTAAEPSIVFTSDDDTSGTGIYRVGANDLGISTNGTLRLDVSTAAVTSTLAVAITDGTNTLSLGPTADAIVVDHVANDSTLGDYLNLSTAGAYMASTSGGFAVGGTGATMETVHALTGFFLTNDTDINWTGSATNSLTTVVTNISSNASGVVSIGTGAVGNKDGFLGVAGIIIPQADLTATCTANQLQLDTGGATPELCFCQATNTWYCIAVTDTTGPAD